MGSHTPLGRLLVEAGYIDETQLTSALSYQRQWGGRLGEALVDQRMLSEPAVYAEIARQRRVPYIEIGDRVVPPRVLRLIPERFIWRRRVFPLAVDRRALTVATSQPHDLALLDEIAFVAGMRVEPVLACDRDIGEAIQRHLGPPLTGTRMVL